MTPNLLKIGTGACALAAICIAPKLYDFARTLFARTAINEVHFCSILSACCADLQSNCSNKYCKARNEQRIIELIRSARHTILLSMYIFTSNALSDAITSAHQRGVRVLIIGCRSMAYSTGSQMTKLNRSDIAVRFPLTTSLLVHHKFCLVDTKAPPATVPAKTIKSDPNAIRLPSNGVLITGSMNWTMQALSGNWDNFIVTSNPELVESFAKEFIVMWERFHLENQVATAKGLDY